MKSIFEKIQEEIKNHIVDGKLDEFGTLLLVFSSISMLEALCKDEKILRLLLEAYHYDIKK